MRQSMSQLGLIALAICVCVAPLKAGGQTYLRKYGVQTTVDFHLYAIDGIDLKIDATDGGADCNIIKDEAVEATCANDFVDEGNVYSIVLTATEMQAARIVVTVIDSATKTYLDTGFVVETYGNASAEHAFDLDAASTAQTGDNYARIGVAGAGLTAIPDVGITQAAADKAWSTTARTLTANTNLENLQVNVMKWAGGVVSPPINPGYPAVDTTFWRGDLLDNTVAAGVPKVDVWYLRSGFQSGIDLQDFVDSGYDPATNKIESVKVSDAATLTSASRAALVDDNWDEDLSGHVTTGTTGRAIDDLPNTAIFFTNFWSAGTISDETYWDLNQVPMQHVLTGGTSDNDSITFTLEIHVLGDNWQHQYVELYKNGVATGTQTTLGDWTQIDDRVYTAFLSDLTASVDATYNVQTNDGKGVSQDFTYIRALDPPLILTAAWNGTYPTAPETGLQTTTKSGDTVTVTGTVETHATRIQVINLGASSSAQNFDGNYNSGTFSLTVGIGSRTGSQQFTLKANKDGGTYGATFPTTDSPAIVLDQNCHSYGSISGLAFEGAGDFALSADVAHDTVTGNLTISNWSAGNDVISYTSSEVAISDSLVYTIGKTYTYSSGGYRDSGTNTTITSRRKANGKQCSTNYLIKVANTSPVLTICEDGNCSSPIQRFQSKTGTAQTYTIRMSSTQELRATPTLSRDAGDAGATSLPSLSGSAPDKTWEATLTVAETDPKNTGINTFTWSGTSATNGAGRNVTTITTNPDYAIGGFIERELNAANHQEFVTIPTMATNKSNTTLIDCRVDQFGVTLTYFTDIGAHANGYTITDNTGAFLATGTYVRVLDSAIYDNGAYNIQISEAADDVNP